jgi:DNA-directed RNA polymerase subunit RPC12/RpoP
MSMSDEVNKDDLIPLAKPVVKEPTVTKAPPAGRKFPCPQCGARLDFDPSARGLKCPYCGFHEEITRDEDAAVAERDYQEYLAREECKGGVIAGRSTETRCTGCGAVVLLEDRVATERCPFCGTHLETKPETAHVMIPPESLLPFKVDLRGAREAFNRWLHGLWFAPNELKRVAALGQLTGVYLPYWTYDAMTYTFYEGQKGIDYTETEWYTATGPGGKTERRSRTVTKTRWYRVSGEVDHFFDDVLVCGSHSLPGDLIDDLGHWHLDKLEPFNPAYLSGFRTERYAVGLKEGLAIAKQLMEPKIDSLIRSDIGGDRQRIDWKRTRYSAITFKHLLLPIWVAVYRYHDKTYQVLVNGRTGRVTGYRPYSWWKIAGLILLVALIAAVIAILVMAFGGR